VFQRLFRSALFAVAVAAVLLSATAQDFADADTREVAAYTLTEAALTKYKQATANLGAIAERIACQDDDDDGEQSIAALVARIDGMPAAKAAIQSAGMTSREYIVFTFSLLTNALAGWAADQPGGQLPPGTSKANVDFLRAHEAELQALDLSAGDDCEDEDGEEEESEDQ
jgi:hypothetical protein